MQQIGKDFLVRLSSTFFGDRSNGICLDVLIRDDLREAIQNLQQQVRSALGFGIAKDGRRFVERELSPTRDRLQRFPCRANCAAKLLNKSHMFSHGPLSGIIKSQSHGVFLLSESSRSILEECRDSVAN